MTSNQSSDVNWPEIAFFAKGASIIILDRKDPFAAYQSSDSFYKTANANFGFFHIMNQLFIFM